MSTTEPWSHRRAHVMLNLTVLVWGFTAIVGKLITISAASLVLYRQLLVVVILVGLFALRRQSPKISARQAKELAGIGLLISLHWVTFYACVHSATASLAALCIATVPFLTSIFEPIVFGRVVSVREAAMGVVVVAAVAALVGSTPAVFGSGNWQGFGVGMFSAVVAGIFGTLNGHIVRKSDIEPLTMTLWELGSGALWLGLGLACFPDYLVLPSHIPASDWLWLLVLAVACTVLPWMWSLRVLKTLTPYAVALATALEPVYAMVFAYLVFPGSERLGPGFYLGTLGLIALVVTNARLDHKQLPQSVAKAHRA